MELSPTTEIKFFKTKNSPKPQKKAPMEGMIYEVVDVVVSGQLTPEQEAMSSRKAVTPTATTESTASCCIS